MQVVAFLGICLKNWNPGDTETFLYIAMLLTMVKIWKQPKCSLINKWVKVWYKFKLAWWMCKALNSISITTSFDFIQVNILGSILVKVSV